MTATKTRREAQRIVRAKRGIILDVGCGENVQEGAVGMDKRDLPGVDIVHDMNAIPWPLENESVISIVASHVVEHINPADGHFIDWMDECWRILKPQGTMGIVAPYGLSTLFVQDPTHCNPVNEKTFWYFDGDQRGHHGGKEIVYWGIYKPKPWKIEASYFSAEGMLEVSLRKRIEVPESWTVPEGTVVTT